MSYFVLQRPCWMMILNLYCIYHETTKVKEDENRDNYGSLVVFVTKHRIIATLLPSAPLEERILSIDHRGATQLFIHRAESEKSELFMQRSKSRAKQASATDGKTRLTLSI